MHWPSLYSCEFSALTAELKRRIQALGIKCYKTILAIPYVDCSTNDETRRDTGPLEDFISTLKKRKLKWHDPLPSYNMGKWKGDGQRKNALTTSLSELKDNSHKYRHWYTRERYKGASQVLGCTVTVRPTTFGDGVDDNEIASI